GGDPDHGDGSRPGSHAGETTRTVLHEMTLALFRELRGASGQAEFRVAQGVARTESAAGGRVGKIRRQTGNGVEVLAFLVDRRNALQQGAGVGVQRAGEKLRLRGAFHDAPGVHDVHVVADL